jgi:hypothetical protein
MTSVNEWRRSSDAERLETIASLLRARFDQIAKAPAPPILIELADRLEAKANQSAAASDDVETCSGQSPPKASDA